MLLGPEMHNNNQICMYVHLIVRLDINIDMILARIN